MPAKPSEPTKPLVSVIITNWNNESYLEQCIMSALSQTLREIEIIVVDDGSTDGSREIIEQIAKTDERIRPLFRENGGFGAAANSGLDAATGDYVAFVDSDDYLASEMYRVLYEAAAANDLDIARADHFNVEGEAGSFSSQLFAVAPPSMYGKVIKPQSYVTAAIDGGVNIYEAFGYIWDCIYKRSFINDNDIRVNEDVPSHNDIGFYFQTIALAERFEYIRAANYYHRTDNAQQSMRDEEKLFRNFFLEHQFIEQRFQDRGLWDQFRDLILRREYSNYLTVLDRLSFDRHEAYVELASSAMKEHASSFHYRTFLGWQRAMVNILVSDPRLFLTRWYEQNYQVSVIIPVFNGEDYLRDTLESVCGQTLSAIEIIVVDDGSTDSTPSIIEEFAAKDSRIVAIRQENAGAGVARNNGTTLAHGRYLYYLDADDTIDPDCLKLAYKATTTVNADLLLFGARTMDASTGEVKALRTALKTELLPKKGVFSLRDFTANPLYAVIGWAWDKLIRREFVIRENLKFDALNVANDGTFTFLALCIAPRISVLNQQLVTHRTNVTDSVSSRHDLYPLDSWHFLESLYDQLNDRRKLNGDGLRRWYANYCLHRIRWVWDRLHDDAAIETWFKYAPEAFAHLGLDNYRQGEVEPARLSDYALMKRMLSLQGKSGIEFKKSLLAESLELPSEEPKQEIVPEKTEGRVVFLGRPSEEGRQWGLPILEIHAMTGPWASTYAVFDLTVLTNHRHLPVGRLRLATTYVPARGDLGAPGGLVLDEFSLDASSDPEIMRDIALVVRGTTLHLWARYTEPYAGLAWQAVLIESRDSRRPQWSPASDTGLTTSLEKLPDYAVFPNGETPIRFDILEVQNSSEVPEQPETATPETPVPTQ